MRRRKDNMMQIRTERPSRRPKLYLPLFLAEAATAADAARTRAKASPFPLSAPELRRVVAEMID
jgi:hypothetical protein